MRSLFTLFVVHALACLPAIAQTKQVLKTISTNGLTESLVVPSGQTLTIASGGTLTAAAGSTITGIGSGLTIGSSTITSGTSGRALYNNSGVLGELDLASLYQPLATNLTSIGALANSAGVLTNNGGGTFSYTSTSTGGNAEVDAGKVVTFNTTGGIRLSDGATGSGLIVVGSSLLPPYIGIKSTEIRATLDITKSVRFEFATPSGTGVQARVVTVPATTGTLITTGDTGTITSTMILDGTIANDDLAGSIALSKLATTGTASASTYLRGDGAWTAIDLSSYLTSATAASTYLPLAGGTMTGALVLPAGSASAPSLTGSDTDSGIYFSTANQIDFTTGGTRRWYIDSTGTLQGGSYSIQLSGNTLGTFFFARGGDYSIGASDDVTMSRDAAARMQMGRDHATTATNQTIKAHDVTTGTGASLDLRGGNGSTAGGTVTISTSDTTTPAVRMTVKASGVINMSGMPTSSAGLSSGDLWNDSGTVKIVP